MHQDASRLRASFVFTGDTVSAASASAGGPGLARVRMELARTGSVFADFDNRASRPRRAETDAGMRL